MKMFQRKYAFSIIIFLFCLLFGYINTSEFVVAPNNGTIRFFRGFQTDEFHFKIRNEPRAKNVSYIYLLDNLDLPNNYGRYLRIAIRYDKYGHALLNIYSYNSGLTASERSARFKDKPGKDGFRGYWLRRRRLASNRRMNLLEFGQESDKLHPIMKVELKFTFLPRYFALEGFSTWKLEQILIGDDAKSFGFFSSTDLSMIHTPKFFSASSEPSLIKKKDQFVSKFYTKSALPVIAEDTLNPPKEYNSSELTPEVILSNQITSMSETKSNSPDSVGANLNVTNVRKGHLLVPLASNSNVNFPKITFPPVTLPSFTWPNFTIPKIDMPKITLPTIQIPSVTFPKFKLPHVTFPDIDFPTIILPKKINLSDHTIPWIEISLIPSTPTPPAVFPEPIILTLLKKYQNKSIDKKTNN